MRVQGLQLLPGSRASSPGGVWGNAPIIIEVDQYHRNTGESEMTRETAKRMIKGHPFSRQEQAREDIDEKDYVSVEMVPVFELDGNNFQFTAMYKIRLEDGGYIYGRAMTIDELCRLQQSAARGEVFRIMYLRKSRIIIEIEEKNV